jgi:hypothetical protein
MGKRESEKGMDRPTHTYASPIPYLLSTEAHQVVIYSIEDFLLLPHIPSLKSEPLGDASPPCPWSIGD